MGYKQLVMHAVQRLFEYRKSISTSPYRSRGHKLVRCNACQLAKQNCICALKPQVSSNAGFVLLMYDGEVLKPSNTGRLIADVLPDTYAFLWDRTDPNKELLALLKDESWQPIVVFPKEYAREDQTVLEHSIPVENGKRPLFIMLDGSWREARKMYHKSPYLNHFPLVSISPEEIENHTNNSRYFLRKAIHANQLATAEVAALVLNLLGEKDNATVLNLWFNVFSYQYQKSVCQKNHGDEQAIEKLNQFIEQMQRS